MEVQWPLLIFSVLLGVTSGCFVFLGVGELKGKFRDVRFAGALIALACLVVGGCASALHLGHPERATHLLGNLASGLSKELFIVAIMGVVSLAYLVLAKKDYPVASKVIGVAGAVLGIVLPLVAGASYLMAARPAWDSVTLPLMYLGAGLGTGMTLMCALVLLRGDASEESGFALRLALAGVVVMAACALAYVAWIAIAPYQDPSRSIERLLTGDLAVLFWLGAVLVGLVVPVALVALALVKATKGDGGNGVADARRLSACLFAACACSVAGAVCLRVVMYGVGTSVEQFIYH